MSAVVAAARVATGVRFRVHGRDREGLDCVGLVAVALRGGGWDGAVPSGYALATGDARVIARVLAAAGLRAVQDARAGDVVAFASGPGQLHLGINTGDGLIHADAGLRRVVERPGAAPWPVVGRWRWEADAWRP
jgi:cell wall-associated NlpC family hydrolase